MALASPSWLESFARIIRWIGYRIDGTAIGSIVSRSDGTAITCPWCTGCLFRIRLPTVRKQGLHVGQRAIAAGFIQSFEMSLLVTLFAGFQPQARKDERTFAGGLAQLRQIADRVVDGVALALGGKQSASQFIQDVLLHGFRRIAQADPGQTVFVWR